MANFTNIDDAVPMTNPFYYHELDQYLSKTEENNLQQSRPDHSATLSKKAAKKRKFVPSLTPSAIEYIMRHTSSKSGKYLIKISINELNGRECKNYANDDNDTANVSVQYIVKDNYDKVMESAEDLIREIGKKLCNME